MIAAIDGGTMVLIIVAGLALFGVIAYYAHQAAKKRRAALLAVASTLGLQFNPARTTALNGELARFGDFDRGFGRSASNVFTGTMTALGQELPVILGDFRYKTRSTDSDGNRKTTTHTFSFGYFRLPFSTPQVAIRREHFMDRIASAMGFDDIDFESAEFSDAFHVTSDDKRFAYDLCHAQMMEFLLRERPPQIHLAAGALLIGNGSTSWRPQNFAEHAVAAQAFLELFPRHLRADLTAASAPPESSS